MRLCSLASGSKGNCYLIMNGKTNILLDFGISYNQYTSLLQKIGFNDEIAALVITHAHSDHIRGISSLLKNMDIPIYCHKNIQYELRQRLNISDLYLNIFDGVFSIEDYDILPFLTPHDTAYSYGFTFTYGGKSISIATDLGHVSDKVSSSIVGSELVLIEANYDCDMLRKGKYPEFLKRRIFSKRGHLSNEDCAELCCHLAKSGTKQILLGHLSENNNCPDIAYDIVMEYLTKNCMDSSVSVSVLEQHTPSGIFEI